MNSRQKKILQVLFCLTVLAGGLLFAATVFAQDFGVNEVGNEIALPSQDPRVFAANIIRVALGFLGIVAVAIVLYGGFVWMTAAGNEERLSKAKKILTSGLIGLIIIIMAFSITSFVISKLMEATGITPGGGGPGGGGPPGGGLPSDAFVVRGIQPNGPIPIRNVVVRVVFNKNVDATTLTDNFSVRKTSDGSLVDGTASALGTVVEFVPSARCPDPNADRFCFDGDTEFTVEVMTGLRSTDGKNLICGGLAPNCTANFTTGNLVDVTGPEVRITSPDPGESVCTNDVVSIEAYATDDAGISYLEYFADGGLLGTDAPAGATPRDYSSIFDWDTIGLMPGTRTLTTKVFDIDTNDTTSGGVDVIVRAEHCCNGRQDEDEMGRDCGGADCGTCDGGSCTSGADCRSGTCIGGVCRTLPTITGVSPPDGAIGNYVTIFGRGFGRTVGQVYFNNVLAGTPACPSSATWQDNQIIVAVPTGATDGSVKVMVPPPTGATAVEYTDQTDDERGPVLPNFDVNDISRPGICSVTPDSGEPRIDVVVAGTQFGSPQPTSEIIFGGTRAERVSIWTTASIGATVPLIAPATVPVQVVVGGQNSNPFDFTVLPSAVTPQILRFEPTHGPEDEYVTIFGANFGNETGQVFFKNDLGVDILFRPDFPAACGTDWWKNDQIIVKVPTGAVPDILKITTGGTAGGQSDDTSDLAPSDFTVEPGTAGPGICKVTPNNGPVSLPVTIDGERFGASAQVNFYRATSPVTVTPTDDTQISTAVSAGAQTGPVTVTSGGATSNGINFSVQDCRAGAACPSGQQCCRDGSCALSPPTGPGCAVAAGRGYYFWQFSTGQIPIYPQVVESCSNPPPPLPPSPSPWSGRSGGDRACVNVELGGRFTTKINSASISGGNILVESCSDQTCVTRTTVAGAIIFRDVSDREDGFTFRPSTNLTRNTWYQITLKSGTIAAPGIRSCLGGAGCPDGGFLLDGDRDGVEGGDYVWQFKTRDSDETCAIGLVGVAPYERTLSSILATQNYTGLCFAAEDVCTMVNCSAYRWGWSSSDVSKATVAGSTTDSEVATARAETEAGRPVRITGEIPSERKSGSGNLTIDFTDPKVVDKWPACQDACSNAEIGAKFNTNMNRTSAENPANVNLYIWKCGNGVLEPGEDCDDGNANPDDGCGATCQNEGSNARYGSSCQNGRRETGEDCDGVPFPERCDSAGCLNIGSDGAVAVCGNGIFEEGEDCDDGNTVSGDGCSGTDRPACLNEGTRPLEEVSSLGLSYAAATKVLTIAPPPITLIPRTYFLPNTYYRVILSDRITSTSGVHLTDLNYPTVSSDSYSWTFKTKNDTNPCAVDRVAVEPQNAILYFIGATQNYISTPFSSPDVCSPNGQRLSALDYPWSWSSGDPAVATITNSNDYPSCGNGVREFGEDCDDGGVSGPGCSATCLNEGTVAPTCGNDIVNVGEDCDDGNIRSGDGCNSSCLHEGSVAGGGVCGNRAIERGEDCDDGGASGPGCSGTCLNEGTVTDGQVDPYQTAEAIDLAAGDVAAGVNSSTTQIEVAETTSGEADRGDLTLRCGGQDCRAISPLCVLTSHICAGTVSQYCENDSDCALGLGRNTCCYFKPKVKNCDPSDSASVCLSGATDVCRNARISVEFDQVMETASVTGNILVVGDYGGIRCPEGTTALALWTGVEKSGWQFVEKIKKWLPAPIVRIIAPSIYKIQNDLEFFGQIKKIINQFGEALFGRPVIAAPASSWCVWPGTATSVVVSKGGDLVTEASFSPTKAFDSLHEYHVLLLGDNPGPPAIEGIRNAKGVALGGGRLHSEYPAPYNGREIYLWSFWAGANICTLDQIVVAPDTHVFKRSGETQDFLATARDVRGRRISRLPGVYYWEWQDWLSNDPTVVQLNPTGTCSNASTRLCNSTTLCVAPGVCQFNEQQTVTAQNKNGEARILVSARITADTVLSPRTVGQVKSGGSDVTVFLCENPWPNSFGITGEALTDVVYNFKTYYCQDRGELVFSDDLPTLPEPPARPVGEIVINNPPAPAGTSGDFLLREYFLFVDGEYCTLSKMPCNGSNPCAPDGGSCQPSPDAVGIRIYTNKYHLQLSDWYLAQGFRPASPAGKTVDQYEAVEDGRTIYVSAANALENTDSSDPADIYTNVYLISYNDGAHQDTIDIYNQLVENWKFNINLDNDKVCKRNGTLARDAAGATISCSADLDCPQNPQSLCDSPKDKLARDVKRLIDLEKIKAAVERYRVTRGYPPKLEAGSYVRGISTSKWDSWAVLSQELGGGLPTDPLNKFRGCTGAYSADTCWSTSEETYTCPGLSQIYQYRYEPGTGFYNIGSDLEYRLGPAINPSWSWFRSSSPTYITYENTCAGVLYSSTGICGDGIIKTTGVCARNSSRSCAADSECVDGGVDQGPCLYEQCEVGDTRIDSSCTPTTGGSGQRSQTCDSANCRWPATWTTCLAKCGNGIIDTDVGETCDRGPGGGRIPGGGTSATREYQCNSSTSGASSCRMTGGWCGDGLLQSGVGERCDDGICTLSDTCTILVGCLCTPATSTTTTTKSCTVKNGGSSCGNGNYGKVCDNDTTISCSVDSECSSSTCRPICATGCVGSAPYCGNTVVDSPREDCDRNSINSKGVCVPVDEHLSPDSPIIPDDYTVPCESSADCSQPEEECVLCAPQAGTGYPRVRTLDCELPGDLRQCRWKDEGWGSCTVTGSCGDGEVQGGEQCDDRNDVNTDACVSCQNSRCGDGQIRTGIEVCDSGAANGTPCSAPYGATCNYCSRECTLRTVSGPVCGDGTVNGAEQCDSRLPASANWICVDTSNPWASSTALSPPGCSPSSCAISCATGRACDNIISTSNPDDDGDGISNSCDPNDDSNVDGCLDDARDCLDVGLRISGSADDAFTVYIDGHSVGQAGRVVVVGSCHLTPSPDLDWVCSYTDKVLQIDTLSRGLHNFRIVYTRGTPTGDYHVDYNSEVVDFGLDSFEVIPGPPPMTHIGEERSIDFTVR